MEDFPSDLEWKLQSLSSPQISPVSCFVFWGFFLGFVFFCQKATKLTYLPGTPRRVCCCSPAAWHSAPLSGGKPRTLKSPRLCPGFPAPNPSSGSLKTAVSTFGTQSSGGERGSLVSPCMNWGSQCPVLQPRGRWEGNPRGGQAGGLKSWGPLTIGWPEEQAPMLYMFCRHGVNLCGGHQQSAISLSPV